MSADEERAPSEASPPEETLTHFPSSAPGASEASPPEASEGAAPEPLAGGTLTHAPSSKGAPQDSAEDGEVESGLEWLSESHSGSGTLTQGLEAPTSGSGGLPRSSEDSARWEPGEVLAGIYEVDSLLGQGGMGAVYRVRHTEWGVDLALKTPLPHLFENPVALQRFQREAETWIDLGLHPNVARCYYVREVEGSPRIFVEFVRGGTLKEWLATQRDPADWRTPLRLALEAADGLAYAHSRGLVHRDVKPANCLLSARGVLRITDFGLVKVTGVADAPQASGVTKPPAGQSPGGLTHFETGMGTPEYAAPEQWVAAGAVDARADVYSWGVLLWELVTGRRPFDAPDDRQPPVVLVNRHCYSELPDPLEHRSDLPSDLCELLRRCLEKEPAQRPATMRDAREALGEIYRGLCEEEPPAVPPTPRVTAAILCNRALSLRDLGQQEAALATWEEALRLEPHHPESRFNLSLLAWRAGELRDLEVVAQLEAVRAVNTRAWIDELLLAQIHVERGEGEAALAILDEIPAQTQERPRVRATRAAAEARTDSRRPVGAPLPRFAAQEGELVGWNKRYLLFLFDPVNRMGSRPGLTVFDRAGKRRAQLDLQGDEALGRTALIGVEASALQGEFALAACLSGTLKVWDLRDGTAPPRYSLRGLGPLEVLAVEGARALAGGRREDEAKARGHASAWDLMRGRRLGSCEHAGPVRALALSGAEAWSADEAELKVWSVKEGALLSSWSLEGVSGIYPCAGGAVLELPEGAVFWDRARGERGQRFSRSALARGVSGETLAEVCADGVRLWSLPRGTCLRTVAHAAAEDQPGLRRCFQLVVPSTTPQPRSTTEPDAPEGADAPDAPEGAPEPDAPEGAAEPEEAVPAALVLPSAAGEPLQRVLLRHMSAPWAAPLALARVESSDAALTLQRAFRRHLRAAKQALKQSKARRALEALAMARAVVGFARHPDALALATALADECPRAGLTTLWEALSLPGDWAEAPQVAFSQTGELLALATPAETTIYEVATGAELRRLEAGGEPQFLPEGALRIGREVFAPGASAASLTLALEPGASEPERVRHDAEGRLAWSAPGNAVWSLEDGALVRPPRPIDERRSLGVLQPGGGRVVGLVGPRTLAVVDLASEEQIDVLACGSAFRVDRLAQDSVGRLLAVGGVNADEPRIQVWDLFDRSLRVNQPWPAPILDLCFLPQRSLLVISDARGKLSLWDHQAAELVRELPHQDPPAERVEASPDGVHLVASRREGVILIYLEWTLSDRRPTSWAPEADDLLVDFCLRQRREAALPAGPSPSELAKWIKRPGRPVWRLQDLEALGRRLGAAGLGGLGLERLQAALDRVRDGGRSTRRQPQARASGGRQVADPRKPGTARHLRSGVPITPRGVYGPESFLVLSALLNESLGVVDFESKQHPSTWALVACGLAGALVGLATLHALLALSVTLAGGAGVFGLQRGRREQAGNDLVDDFATRLRRVRGEVLPADLEAWLPTCEPAVWAALRRSLPQLRQAL